MGSNQSKKSSLSTYNGNDYNEPSSDSLIRLKRRKSNSSSNLNRSPSSPVINPKTKTANLENIKNLDYHNNISTHTNINNQQNSSNLTSSKSSYSTNTYSTPSPRIPLKENFETEPKRFTPRAPSNMIDHNRQMKTNQQQLSKIVKQSDSNQPSYHLNSKLYKPKSLVANAPPNQNVSKNNSQSKFFLNV